MGTSATLREIFQMMPISSKSLNVANSGSRGPKEEVKKGKSSEFNPQNDGQFKTSQAFKVFLYEGFIFTQFFFSKFITIIGGCGAKFRNGYDPGVVVPA